ncbi:MAG: TIGR00730 family Rossman fold protein [Chloroflexi bacterium]|nr:TIGR00730 family Rossman fold protein [Chloroflexota bacterium]
MNICVYCASSRTIAPHYFDLAAAVGAHIAKRGDTLIYGGASIGLMGALARAVQADGGHVVGVIPERLVSFEIANHDADELIITADMRTRKATMEDRADAFLALPGGLGTLEEIFEIMTLRQLGMLAKPLVLLNAEGFYDPLLRYLADLMSAGFVRASYAESFHVAATLADAFAHIDHAAPVG